MTTMPDNLNMDWVDSVKVHILLTEANISNFQMWLSMLLSLVACSKFQHVFEYFTERTPRSHFELRETSLVWNYKYAGKKIFLN